MKSKLHPYFHELLLSHGVLFQKDKEDQDCPIYKVGIGSHDVTLTHSSCKISYHRECLEHWRSSSKAYPFDRQPFAVAPKHERQHARTLAREAKRVRREASRRRLNQWFCTLDATFGRFPHRDYQRDVDFAVVIMEFELRLAYQEETGIPRDRHLQGLTEQILRADTGKEIPSDMALRFANERLQAAESRHFFGMGRTECDVEAVLWAVEEMGVRTHFFPREARHYRRRHLVNPVQHLKYYDGEYDDSPRWTVLRAFNSRYELQWCLAG